MDHQPLSDYEKLRLRKIERNQKRLRELGLDGPVPLKSRAVGKTKQPRNLTNKSIKAVATRWSTRKRKMVDYYEDGPKEEDAGTDYDIDDNSDDEDASLGSESDAEEDSVLSNGPMKKKVRLNIETKPPPQEVQADTTGGLTCEFAKTGRSTCRKCGEKIEKGAPRIGMKAWIVGRQAITWQRPKCLLSNLVCSYDATGRTRCKLTGRQFMKGELKIGIRSHTATSFYGLESIGSVLGSVVKWLGAAERDEVSKLLQVEQIEGSDAITKNERGKVQAIFSAVKSTSFSNSVNGGKETTKNDEEVEVRHERATIVSTTKQGQPKAGSRSGAKGRVEWKFGGHLCYGTLIPSKETKTHCFARTHKGNVKTLAKGKGYWSMIDQE